ncbi:MAG TPA: hypothetical protein VM599_07410 [Thermoanaerobaculia bacterium]|nr:hypothetical protein [Thermoanaerobaculia bacterium]
MSPSLWYDDRLAQRLEEAYAREHDALPGRAAGRFLGGTGFVGPWIVG